MQHKVTLSKGFFLQTTPVTQGQWKSVMGENPSRFKSGGDNCPVENISWNDAQGFIMKLREMDGNVYRLPSEAEWEYACRAGTETPFHFGKCLSTNQANYDGNHPMENCPEGEYRRKTIPVANFEPNTWGLYDMHGNVWEWCNDWYDEYSELSFTNPEGPINGEGRVLRGGSWYCFAWRCRSAFRDWIIPTLRRHDLGFRLVLPPGQ